MLFALLLTQDIIDSFSYEWEIVQSWYHYDRVDQSNAFLETTATISDTVVFSTHTQTALTLIKSMFSPSRQVLRTAEIHYIVSVN